MGKVGYLIKRIKGMNYSQMFNTIDYIHEKTNKNKVGLFFDIIHCGLKYQAGYMDYKLFEMYDLNSKQRKTIITRGINNSFVKKYNNLEYVKYFNNKIEFNKKFDKYLNREWLFLNECSYEEFEEFTKKHKEIIVKPVDSCCGKGIEKIKITSKNIKEVYDELISSGRTLVEEVAIQDKKISKLHPSSINTLRIVTLNQEIVATFIRIGNNNNVVDNFNHEGLVAPVSIETGTIDYVAIDKKGNQYTEHPLTNEKILGLEIPNWNNIKKLIKEVSKVIPEMGYVGWDVCCGEEKPFLIEGNEFPGNDVYQLPPHRTNGMGLLPRFEKAMNKENQ